MLIKMAITSTVERGKVYVWTDGEGEIYVGNSEGRGLRMAPIGIYEVAHGKADPKILDYWYWCLGGNVYGA